MADPNGHRRLPAGAPGHLDFGSASAGEATIKSSVGDAMVKSSAGDAMPKSAAGDAMINSSRPVRPYRIGAPGRLNLDSASTGDFTINSSADDATTKSSAGDAMTKSSAGDAMINSSPPARPYRIEDSGVSIAAQQKQQRVMIPSTNSRDAAASPDADQNTRDADFPLLLEAPPAAGIAPPPPPPPRPRTPGLALTEPSSSSAAATGAMGSSSLAPAQATLAEAKTLPCADHVPLPANELTRKSSSILNLLADEVMEDILLRLPAEDPKLLVRVSLVCRHWMRVVSNPAFLRRYRRFHPPPMLGFLIDHFDDQQGRDVGRFIATTSTFRPQPDKLEILKYSSVLDCRHGIVLLDVKVSATNKALIVNIGIAMEGHSWS